MKSSTDPVALFAAAADLTAPRRVQALERACPPRVRRTPPETVKSPVPLPAAAAQTRSGVLQMFTPEDRARMHVLYTR